MQIEGIFLFAFNYMYIVDKQFVNVCGLCMCLWDILGPGVGGAWGGVSAHAHVGKKPR